MFEIIITPKFLRLLKRLIKKYPSLQEEFYNLTQQLRENPYIGTPIANGCYKIRVAIASKGKGKSGGARAITHVVVQEERLYFLSIYDKSEMENLPENEILKLIRDKDL
jgi:mRNA-degrading endonuclease RelE of RelBE toxin-antitoxin system